MTISAKRQSAIYAAVHGTVMDLRIKLMQEHGVTADVDHLIAQAGQRAASEAVSVACTGKTKDGRTP